MGFEVTSDCAVAEFSDTPPAVPKLCQNRPTVPLNSMPNKSPTSSAVVKKPVVADARRTEAVGTESSSTVAHAAASPPTSDVSQQSLYRIIRQRSKGKLASPEEQTVALSSVTNDSVVAWKSDTSGTHHPERESSVKFCLENNAFISASSAEESQCRLGHICVLHFRIYFLCLLNAQK